MSELTTRIVMGSCSTDFYLHSRCCGSTDTVCWWWRPRANQSQERGTL